LCFRVGWDKRSIAVCPGQRVEIRSELHHRGRISCTCLACSIGVLKGLADARCGQVPASTPFATNGLRGLRCAPRSPTMAAWPPSFQMVPGNSVVSHSRRDVGSPECECLRYPVCCSQAAPVSSSTGARSALPDRGDSHFRHPVDRDVRPLAREKVRWRKGTLFESTRNETSAASSTRSLTSPVSPSTGARYVLMLPVEALD